MAVIRTVCQDPQGVAGPTVPVPLFLTLSMAEDPISDPEAINPPLAMLQQGQPSVTHVLAHPWPAPREVPLVPVPPSCLSPGWGVGTGPG